MHGDAAAEQKRPVGTHIAFVWVDAPNTLLMVDHNGMSFEMFGKSGRLWKTDTISSGGFREVSLEDGIIAGEARRGPGEGWVGFSVKVATGEVVSPMRFDEREGRSAGRSAVTATLQGAPPEWGQVQSADALHAAGPSMKRARSRRSI